DCCDTCAPPKCHAPAPRCEAKCEPACGSCCEKSRLFHSHRSCDTCGHANCGHSRAAPTTCAPSCAATSCCDSCNSGPGLLERLRACFQRDRGCCDNCASGCC